MTIPISRQGQVYLKKEAAYGVQETLAAANALLTLPGVQMAFDPFMRVTSGEKKQSPGPVTRFDRKRSASLGGLVALVRPSGILNTLPNLDPILECAMGAVTNKTVATTVASGPTTTGATVAAAGALAIGDAVLLEVTGQPGPFVRILTNVVGNALTWAPALPAAQTVGDDVKGCITYKLTSALALSLTLAHYLASTKNRALVGLGIEALALSFQENAETQITVSGPAKTMLTATTTPAIQAKPSAFTTVGGNPPSGLVGEVRIDAAAYLIKSMEVSLANALQLRNTEYGVESATEVYRRGRREISVSLETYAESAVLYDLAEAGTNVVLLNQEGRTEGNIFTVYMPRVEFKVPSQSDDDEEANYSFTGMALESVDGANDEMTIAFA